MAGERTPFGASSDHRAGSAAAPVWLRGALTLAVVAALGVVVIEIAQIGPFAPAPTEVAATASQPPTAAAGAPLRGAALPRGPLRLQFLATGRPSSAPAAPAEVRAWQLERSCAPHRGCRVQFARQLVVPSSPNEASDRTLLRPLAGGSAYEADFPAVATRCGGAGTSAHDRFVMRWDPAARRLTATETSDSTCDGRATTSSYVWSGTLVATPAVPAMAASRRHAPTVAAFRRAASAVCTRVNTLAEPMAGAVGRDERILRSGSQSSAAKAAADADIAHRFRMLLPLQTAEYTGIPRPPAGPVDRLWMRDVRANQALLTPGARLLDALAGAASAAARSYLTADPADRETALAEVFLAEDDATRMSRAALADDALERRQLRLPRICTDPPAVEAIFSAPPVSTSA